MQPTDVYWFANDAVMVFDSTGEQMPELQGMHSEAVKKLQAINLGGCTFKRATWGVPGSEREISKTEFFGSNS